MGLQVSSVRGKANTIRKQLRQRISDHNEQLKSFEKIGLEVDKKMGADDHTAWFSKLVSDTNLPPINTSVEPRSLGYPPVSSPWGLIKLFCLGLAIGLPFFIYFGIARLAFGVIDVGAVIVDQNLLSWGAIIPTDNVLLDFGIDTKTIIHSGH